VTVTARPHAIGSLGEMPGRRAGGSEAILCIAICSSASSSSQMPPPLIHFLLPLQFGSAGSGPTGPDHSSYGSDAIDRFTDSDYCVTSSDSESEFCFSGRPGLVTPSHWHDHQVRRGGRPGRTRTIISGPGRPGRTIRTALPLALHRPPVTVTSQ